MLEKSVLDRLVSELLPRLQVLVKKDPYATSFRNLVDSCVAANKIEYDDQLVLETMLNQAFGVARLNSGAKAAKPRRPRVSSTPRDSILTGRDLASGAQREDAESDSGTKGAA